MFVNGAIIALLFHSSAFWEVHKTRISFDLRGDPVLRSVHYALIPVGAALIAAVVTTFWLPGKRLRSYIQHLAAGVVFAAVVAEMFPRLLQAKLVGATLIGFVVGVGLFLAIRSLTGKEGNEQSISVSYVAAICADLFVDGWVIGLGFVTGKNEGKLLTLALSIELVSLGLALGSQFIKAGKHPLSVIGYAALINASLLAGAGAGAAILPVLSNTASIAVIAFGSAALLYLVTEELLVEAHEEFESPLAASLFFAGFLLIFILDIAN